MKSAALTRVLSLLALLALLAGLLAPVRPASAQAPETNPAIKAEALLQQMTPEEKVAQLFLVTFDGSEIDISSRIYQLVHDYHIGGVVLKSENDNFTGPANTVTGAAEMIAQLQSIAWEGAQGGEEDDVTPVNPPSQYIPLFIGISQEGDRYPYDQIIHGVTPLPNQMAIGATWNTDLAYQVGQVLGSELKAMGFNLFFGPSLDVLEVVHGEVSEDLGTRTFGGDPYWVARMGQAYIKGLHDGSGSGIAVIAKHFPGQGGSDRPPDTEVATVRKSLEQLKQIELFPFFQVTSPESDPGQVVDGLLVSHIRYQGFQGNIRATTRPISLDQAALEQVMGLEPFSQWHQNGGIIISDDLGSTAIRLHMDPTGEIFDARQVARNAFLAGNDLLYVDNFVGTNDQDAFTTIVRTLDHFAQKYREDPAFAQRVDNSVRRLLTLKYRLYPEFTLQAVLPDEADLENVGNAQSVSFEVARQAVTMISPDPSELQNVLPQPPELSDRIIFLTDVMTARQCSTCPERAIMPVDALQEAVLRLYGPQAGGQILDILLSSYSFNDLNRFLDDPTNVELMENDLLQADWVVVSMLNTSPNRSASGAFKRLLSERPDLVRNKRVVVFAFNAPYFLDATDISKITAYYGLYSKSSSFVDVAARILFQELPALGALPVSVPGAGYDLITATSPDPNQTIPLFLDYPPENAGGEAGETLTPVPSPPPGFQVNDTIPLRTGVIVDHNNHPVPDGTVVRFVFTTSTTDAITTQQVETVTRDGVAETSFKITTQGILEIRVESEPARNSIILRLDVINGQPAPVIEITITPEPTQTPTLTPTVTPTETLTATVAPEPPDPPGFGGWLLAMVAVWTSTGGIFWLSWQNGSLRWAVRWGLMSAMGGLAGYILYILLWKSDGWTADAGAAGVLAATLAGVALGCAGGWIWQHWLAGKPAGRSRSSLLQQGKDQA